jgi:hypothetical protein
MVKLDGGTLQCPQRTFFFFPFSQSVYS